MDQIVRGGEQYQHRFPETVEPDVDARVRILWEDDALVVVNKPAPLPVHPCGRFNRNTLTSFLTRVYGPSELRVVHRLDANTTGLQLLARHRDAARSLATQFEANEVQKTYLVRCVGHPTTDVFECNAPIAKDRGMAGTRGVEPGGLAAVTQFRVRARDDDTALLEARPLTGRTNQIRIHLWAIGMPVVGDPAYLPNQRCAATQTLRVDQPPMCLHAARLSLKHPLDGRLLNLAAPDPGWAACTASR